MKKQWLGLFTALALTACPTVGQITAGQTAPGQTAPSATAGTISGNVTVPSGTDVKDTIVIACFLLGTEACDEQKSGGTLIAQSGSSAAYSIPNLTAGEYVVLAVKVTLDAKREIKSIDYLGGYGSDRTRVRPPASGIDVQLRATPTTQLGAPGTGTPSTGPAPAGQVGTDVVGSWNGRASGTDLYSIKADGTYSRTLIDTTGCYRIERREAGNAITSGNQIDFYPTSNFTKMIACGSYSEDRSPAPNTSFRYRFETDPVNANTYLFLRPASGTELQYLKE